MWHISKPFCENNGPTELQFTPEIIVGGGGGEQQEYIQDGSPLHLRTHTIHPHTHTWGPTRVSDPPNVPFGLLRETRVPRENHRENKQMQNIIKIPTKQYANKYVLVFSSVP